MHRKAHRPKNDSSAPARSAMPILGFAKTSHRPSAFMHLDAGIRKTCSLKSTTNPRKRRREHGAAKTFFSAIPQPSPRAIVKRIAHNRQRCAWTAASGPDVVDECRDG